MGALSGREIGGAITTFIGRLGDPAVVNRIEELSNGIIKVRDASGELRPASDVFLELATAIDQAILTPQQGQSIVDAIVPPLNPGQRAVLNIILENVPDALQKLGPILSANAQDAKELSDNLVSGPAERFDRAIKELQVSLLNTFSDDVINSVTILANAVSAIAGAFDGAGGQVLSFVVKIAALGAALAGAKKIWDIFYAAVFGSILRQRAVNASIAAAAATAATTARGIGAHAAATTAAGAASAAAVGPITAFAGALTRARIAAVGLLSALGPLLAIQAAIMTLDFFAEVGRQADEFSSKVGGTISSVDDLSVSIARLEALRSASGGENQIEQFAKSIFVNPAIEEDIRQLKAIQQNMDLEGKSAATLTERLKELRAEREKMGLISVSDEAKQLDSTIAALEKIIEGIPEGGRATFAGMIDSIFGTTAATDSLSDAQSEAERIQQEINAALREGTDAYEDYTTAEERAALAAQTIVDLSDAKARAILSLNDQLRNGAITVSEFEQAQGNIDNALQASADFIAAYGDQLDLIPGLQERIARTGEDAAEALFNLLLENPATLDQQIGVIEQMIAIVEANEEVAQNLAENPITPRVNNAPIQNDATVLRGLYEGLGSNHTDTALFFEQVKPTPQLNLSVLRVQLQEALRAYELLSTLTGQQLSNIPEGVDDLGGRFGGPGARFGTTTSAVQQRIEELRRQIAALEETTEGVTDSQTDSLVSALRDQLSVLQGIREGDARLENTLKERQAPQTALVDVGELSAAQVQQAIRMARALQAAIPGAGAEAADETVALIRDARFLQFIQGLDQRFLTEAIQELTEVERRRLELEQQRLQDVTRSIVTRVGPIQSLVSSPVLAAGGGILSGQGLNADPRMGNITINVPINWSGMSLSQLQDFIFKSISQAWIDAGRGG